jgi:hypothetical protein
MAKNINFISFLLVLSLSLDLAVGQTTTRPKTTSTLSAVGSSTSYLYYGGSVSSRPIFDNGNGTVTLEVTITSGFQRSGSPSTWCNDTFVVTQNPVANPGMAYCLNGCLRSFSSAVVNTMFCESFSEVNNWSLTQFVSELLVLKSNSYIMAFQNLTFSNIMVSGAPLPAPAALLTFVQNSNTRSDKPVINTTPITIMPPLITLAAYT